MNFCQTAGLRWRQFRLLLWKNLLLRKRGWKMTCCELLIPLIMQIIFVWMKKYQFGIFEVVEQPDQHFQSYTDVIMLTKVPGFAFGKTRILSFAPDTPFTRNLMFDASTDMGIDVKDMLPCVDEKCVVYAYERSLTDPNKPVFIAGIVFQDLPSNGSEVPKDLVYSIRLLPKWHTRFKYPFYILAGYEVMHTATKYMNSRFSGIQIALDRAFTNMACTNDCGKLQDISVALQAFPYPAFESLFAFKDLFEMALPTFIMYSYILLSITIIKGIVHEKETGVKEVLHLIGVPHWVQWASWMASSIVVLLPSVIINTCLYVHQFPDGIGAILNFVSPSIFFIMLCLYLLSSIAFCFAVSAFFSKPSLATMTSLILWLLSFYGPLLPALMQYRDMDVNEKRIYAILPNMALSFGMKVLGNFEGNAIYLDWSKLFVSGNPNDEMTMGFIFFIFITDTIILMFISWYVSCLMPGEYGVPKRWNFIFKRSFWKKAPKWSNPTNTHLISPYFEPGPRHLQPGIDICRLRKEHNTLQGRIVAVNDVDLKAYQGEIMALVGHNGAGKTTLMSTITGMCAPTRGTAYVNGYDICTNLDEVQESLGLCPQQNILFLGLTTMEHLILFGMLKGLNYQEAKLQADHLLKKLHISVKENFFAHSLSGGQKRKLSLGMAMMGNPKVLMLDEPTSGMDPQARRAVWDLLLELRGSYTVFLTTHFMEEADVLGDRIAIMSHGKIHCCGSPLFLKRLYGAGYHLTLTMESDDKVTNVNKFINSWLPDTQQISKAGGELSFLLPTENMCVFPKLLNALEQDKTALGIKSFGVSLTTIDEVFVKVGEISDLAWEKEDLSHEVKIPIELLSTKMEEQLPWNLQNRVKGVSLKIQQISALFEKRLIYFWRRKRFYFTQALIPAFLSAVCVWLSNWTVGDINVEPKLWLELNEYNDYPITPIWYTDGMASILANEFKSLIQKGHVETIPSDTDISEHMLKIGHESLGKYRQAYVIGADFMPGRQSESNVIARGRYSPLAFHGAGIALNMIDNTILRMFTNRTHSIKVANYPLPTNPEFTFSESLLPEHLGRVSLMFLSCIPIGLILLSGLAVIPPLQERVSQCKQIQIMTGVSPIMYWSVHYVCDVISFIICTLGMLPVFFIYDKYGTYGDSEAMVALFLLILFFAICATPFAYLFSINGNTVAGCFSTLILTHVVTGMIATLLVWFLKMLSTRPVLLTVASVLETIFKFFPGYPVSFALVQFMHVATNNNKCAFIPDDVKEVVCASGFVALLVPEAKECCDNLCRSATGCSINKMPFLTWTVDNPVMGFKHEMGLLQSFQQMALNAVIYMTILMLIEYKVFNKIWNKFSCNRVEPPIVSTYDDYIDSDVEQERQKVKASMESIDDNHGNSLIVDNVWKQFDDFSAVRGLSFRISPGECFGLLGVNGAGKTTTFRILTGDLDATYGNANLNSSNLVKQSKEFLQHLGYCPQFDGVIDSLTGREMLVLFSKLRGWPKDKIKPEVNKWLEIFGLKEYANQRCGQYSGGTRRRLSTAIAFLAYPPVIFLDEPTSGVDPVARRRMWAVLANARANGQSMLFTSHSMEECEVICSRIGVMTNGRLRCLGGSNHLKHKFGEGFSVLIKLNPQCSSESYQELPYLKEEIENKLAPCELKDEHQGLINYRLLDRNMSWSHMFSVLEELKQRLPLVEDYSVSATSLEQIFLGFAREHETMEALLKSMSKQKVRRKMCVKIPWGSKKMI